jgi:hypothetical protein
VNVVILLRNGHYIAREERGWRQFSWYGVIGAYHHRRWNELDNDWSSVHVGDPACQAYSNDGGVSNGVEINSTFWYRILSADLSWKAYHRLKLSWLIRKQRLFLIFGCSHFDEVIEVVSPLLAVGLYKKSNQEIVVDRSLAYNRRNCKVGNEEKI